MATPGVAYHPVETLDERARTLAELTELFAEVGAEHVLIGGIAVGYHGRLRATVDVDMLVPRDRLAPLARALEARGYVVSESHDMVRVFRPGSDPDEDDAIADLVAREANPVLDAAAQHHEPATVLGQRVRIVPRGALVALKFHAAVSPRREIGDKYQAIADISRIIAKRFDAADEALALEIAGHAFEGASEELETLLDDLRHGRAVKI